MSHLSYLFFRCWFLEILANLSLERWNRSYYRLLDPFKNCYFRPKNLKNANYLIFFDIYSVSHKIHSLKHDDWNFTRRGCVLIFFHFKLLTEFFFPDSTIVRFSVCACIFLRTKHFQHIELAVCTRFTSYYFFVCKWSHVLWLCCSVFHLKSFCTRFNQYTKPIFNLNFSLIRRSNFSVDVLRWRISFFCFSRNSRACFISCTHLFLYLLKSTCMPFAR